jgi:glycosyltransferase involved in cell wall biosynthesis
MIVTDQYPPMIGGVPSVTSALAHDFAARGHEVSVVAPSYGPRDVEHRVEKNVHVFRFSSFEWPAYKELRIPFLPLMPMRRLIQRRNPDIIHLHSPAVLGNIAQIMGGNLRKPLIITNHYLPVNISRSLTTDPVIGKYFSFVSYSYLVNFCNHSEYVTAPTRTALQLLYEHGLHAPSRVISNGIDLKQFTPGDYDPQVMQRYQLPQDRPLILHVNRLSEEKRVDVLLHAVTHMKCDAHVALVSTGPMLDELVALTAQLHIEDRVSFLGFVPDNDLLALRHSSTLFAIPSEADLQSLATMEAMACGLPVVAANSYALPELVHHNENGFLFTPGDSEELARDIDTILNDADLRTHMSQKSLDIIAKHDRSLILDEWEEVYDRLSREFVEAKERKIRWIVSHKYPHLPPVERPRMRKTGPLFH